MKKLLLLTIISIIITNNAYAASITVNRINKIQNPRGKLIGFAEVTVNDIIIRGMRIVEGRDGVFVAPPQRQGRDNEFYPIVTIPRDVSDEITKLVILEMK